MSLTVRRSPVLICLREEVVKATQLVMERRKEVQSYLQSQQVVYVPSKKSSLKQDRTLAQFSTQQKSLRGLEAGFAIIDFLNHIYKNLQNINVFLQKCTQEEFYQKVGKLTKYTDTVLATLREETRSRLKYTGLGLEQQQHLVGPGFFQKPYTQRLKQLAKSLVLGTIRTRDIFMEKVSTTPASKKRKVQE